MYLWIGFLVLALMVGLGSNRIGLRQWAIIIVLAASLSVLYFFLPRLV